ncbi:MULTISPECIES: hypothetical protein [unclassified Ensifer]|nr:MULTISPECIES: hypothetical protein [unclassified Ensifer]
MQVTMVDPRASYGRNGEEPGADIAAYLVRHGVSVAVERCQARDAALTKG